MSDPTPQAICPDVHLIRSLPDSGGPLRVAVNSLVLTGTEPVLVDTGAAVDAEAWWAQVESVVDPDDVRWIFLSHDDVDHYGNLLGALDRCPAATLVASWMIVQRLGALGPLPAERCRWVNDGERFTAGDRELVAIRPPAYDSPTTRGLYDATSGIYWASDCCGTPVPHPADEVAQLDRDVWDEGYLRWHRLLSPWATQVEAGAWRRAVGRIAGLELRAIASAHGPVIGRRDVGHALDLLGELPGMAEVPHPGQSELSGVLALPG